MFYVLKSFMFFSITVRIKGRACFTEAYTYVDCVLQIFLLVKIILILELGGRDFSLEAARSLILMVDRDRNGKLEYSEFRDMWQTMKGMYVTFKECDKDNNDHMNAVELRNALAKLGFSLSTPVLSSLALRYANKKGFVNVDDFIQICCRVKSTFGMFVNFIFFFFPIKIVQIQYLLTSRSGLIELLINNFSG